MNINTRVQLVDEPTYQGVIIGIFSEAETNEMNAAYDSDTLKWFDVRWDDGEVSNENDQSLTVM